MRPTQRSACLLRRHSLFRSRWTTRIRKEAPVPTEAVLALQYDPTVLSVSAADITLGTIPSHGAGWQLRAVVDQATGVIGIELFSETPVSVNDAGSLVNIAFQKNADALRLLAKA